MGNGPKKKPVNLIADLDKEMAQRFLIYDHN